MSDQNWGEIIKYGLIASVVIYIYKRGASGIVSDAASAVTNTASAVGAEIANPNNPANTGFNSVYDSMSGSTKPFASDLYDWLHPNQVDPTATTTTTSITTSMDGVIPSEQLTW